MQSGIASFFGKSWCAVAIRRFCVRKFGKKNRENGQCERIGYGEDESAKQAIIFGPAFVVDVRSVVVVCCFADRMVG